MTDFLEEQNSLMEKIIRDYGSLIRGAVGKAACGQPWGDDIVSEVYFAVLLTVRKFGTDWTPPKSFIFTVVRNKVNDFLRQKYREKNGIQEIQKQFQAQSAQKEEVVSKMQDLTASEFRVFRMLGLGLTNNEMAESLHISLHTIRSHMKKIHAKCGVKDRSKLTLIAHLVCYREMPERIEAESEPADLTRLRNQRAQVMAEDGEPELWEPAPCPLPAIVKGPIEYVS